MLVVGRLNIMVKLIMSLRKIILMSLVFFLLAGCATGSIRMIGANSTYTSGSCEVKLFQSKDQAIANGMTKEICVIEGSSAYSFDHSIEGAIKNNIDKVCKCGVTKAYVASAHTESHMGIKGVSYVNLVGFK